MTLLHRYFDNMCDAAMPQSITGKNHADFFYVSFYGLVMRCDAVPVPPAGQGHGC
jgi:hypothetical protein